MINKISKLISLAVIFLLLLSFSPQTTQADMDSSSYKIIFDSINVGGLDYGSSETYGLRDSIGQLGSGLSQSFHLNWTEATSEADWSARLSHTSVVFDDKMWVLGGYFLGSARNDVWYSTDGVNWTEATSSADWSARHSHTSVVYDDKMWVLGGWPHSNDVWYSTDGINWTEATSSAAWSARIYHTSVVYDNKMWIIGGEDDVERKNDVWYSTDGVNWIEATSSADWSARLGHTSVVFNDKVWVLGGRYGSTYKNDVWYSTDGVNWIEATSSADWLARYSHTSVVYDDKMWVLGGLYINTRLDDVWYSTNGVDWIEVVSSEIWTPRDLHTSVVYDDKMWVLGGRRTSTIPTNDVWLTTFNEGVDYQVSAGYRQAYEDSFITVSGGGNLSLGELSGPGSTTQGNRFWKVTTNYDNYSLSVKSDISPTIQRIGGGASFSDYSPDSLDPDYEFILPSSESVFAFSPDGPDIVSNYLHDNIVCNSGSNSSLDNCWDGLSTSNKLISYGDSNYPTGATTTINFKAGIGSSAVLSAGDYQGAVLVTILPL